VRALSLLAVLSLAAAPLPAQETAPARAEDVATIDGILSALYQSISGPAGAERDWPRMSSLFVPDGRLMPTGKRPDGTSVRQSWSVDEYIRRAGPGLKENGFFEREIGRRTDQFGNVVQVFSTYESRRAANDPEPFMRGINSIQLWNDGSRWWVVSILWQNESPDTPIPAQYLGN
jgi:hypothetical protein